MKKLGVILIISLLFIIPLILEISIAQENIPGMPAQLQNPEETIQKLKNTTETSWEYLSKEWQNILLKNTIVAKIDTLLKKIPEVVFMVLFSMPYSLTPSFLATIILWLYFALLIGDVLMGEFGAKAYIGGFGAAIILAQVNFFKFIETFFIYLIFMKKAVWWNILITGIIIAVLAIIFMFSNKLSAYLDERKKKEKEKEADESRERTIAFEKAREKAMTEGKWTSKKQQKFE